MILVGGQTCNEVDGSFMNSQNGDIDSLYNDAVIDVLSKNTITSQTSISEFSDIILNTRLGDEKRSYRMTIDRCRIRMTESM